MQYMLLCCIDGARWSALGEEGRAAVMRDYGAWIAEMERLGKHVASARLAPASAARTIRHDGARRLVVDGPFAETKEQFGGYHLLDCRDLDEAMALAARIPTLPHGGAVEVRALEAGA